MSTVIFNQEISASSTIGEVNEYDLNKVYSALLTQNGNGTITQTSGTLDIGNKEVVIKR